MSRQLACADRSQVRYAQLVVTNVNNASKHLRICELPDRAWMGAADLIYNTR